MNHLDYPDVPAHDAPLTVDFEGRRCSACGRTSNPPRYAVADFPDPVAEDPRDALTCVDCYADRLTDATPLDTNHARVLALQLAGYSHEQIGRALGRSVTRIERWAQAVRDEHRATEQRTDALAAVMQYL